MNIKHIICDKCYIKQSTKMYLCRKFLQMLKKGTVINSILTGSCPRCQEESMYVEKNPYKLKTIYKMHETCSHCKTQYFMVQCM